MKRRFTGSDETPNILSDGFIEAMWDMLIALGMAAAICIGVISLSAHLSATQKVASRASRSFILRSPQIMLPAASASKRARSCAAATTGIVNQ
jgi:hypothetical protein